ncbi:uncharacterized protein [Branchiostoma lanceolatum]|uniref:uncharacterized protein n=1 Tax=Branchiostoma lanceolatum TaxID=7740 RepID=UPI0034521CBA
MASLVRGATRWLSSALQLRGAPGRKLHIARGEEAEGVFRLLEAYNEHVDGRTLYNSAAVRPKLTLQKNVTQVGFSIDTMLMQEALSGTSALNICSKPSAFELKEQARPKKYFQVKNGKATFIEE